MGWLDGITDSMDMNLSKFWESGEGPGSLVSCSPWGHKESDRTEQLNNRSLEEGLWGQNLNLGEEAPPRAAASGTLRGFPSVTLVRCPTGTQ